MTTSLSRRLARWVHELSFADLPAEVVDRALGVTLQGLTSCLLASDFPEARQALAIMEDDGAAAGPATVLVLGRKLGRSAAAYVNAEMMLAGGKWDTFRMVTHPGCAVLPAALAAAESTQCSGQQYLTAVAAGYEVMQRLAADFVPTVMARGFHAGPVFGIFGAAVAAGKILGLSSEQLHVAIAQCVNLAAGNLEGGRSGGKSIREGAAARNGLLAVAIARNGGVGGETTLEGDAGFYRAYAGTTGANLPYSFTDTRHVELDAISRDLGQEWLFLETLFRIYSTAGYNIPHVDVTARLCAREGIHGEDVASIVCEVNWLETQYPSPAFPSRRTDVGPAPERPHYYAAYAAFERDFPVDKNIERGVGPPDPPGVADLMRRVRVVASHSRPLFAPRITIVTRNGSTHTLESSGREFIMDFGTLAQRLAPLQHHVPVGAAGYSALVRECSGLPAAPSLRRLISTTCGTLAEC